MNWLESLLWDPTSVAHIVCLYAFVISVGVLLGKIKVFGVSLGVTFVLFTGILMGHFGFTGEIHILHFIREFGLILFVFCIGLQVGPSFFATFRNGGWGLNGLTLFGVLLSLAVTIGLFFIFKGDISLAQMMGVHFGAVTSTPGLGATQEALHAMGNHTDITVGYACAYPVAIIAMILAILFLKKAFHVDIAAEDEAWAEHQMKFSPAPIYYHVTVTNKALDGRTLKELRDIIDRPFICSRILHDAVITSPTANCQVHLGDKLRIVSNKDAKLSVVSFFGEEDKTIDLATEHSPLMAQSIRVTRSAMNGVRIEQLHLSHLDGVNITRVTRPASSSSRITASSFRWGTASTAWGRRIHSRASRISWGIRRSRLTART